MQDKFKKILKRNETYIFLVIFAVSLLMALAIGALLGAANGFFDDSDVGNFECF